MKQTNNSGGIGIFGALGVFFIGLKLTGYITWSWVWVLSPLWLPVIIIILLIVIISILTQ